jgi:hypothetical protein
LAEIVNLRRARKDRRRQESEKQAKAARSLAGETKSARQARERQSAELDHHLDRHRLARQPLKDER